MIMKTDDDELEETPSQMEGKAINLFPMIAEMLETTEEDVRENSDLGFVELGGSSVKAIQLAFQLEKLGVSFKVEEILDMDNSIEQLAEQAGSRADAPPKEESASEVKAKEAAHDQLPPFSILQDFGFNVDESQTHSAEQINCSTSDIEDILPMTAQQRGLWLGSLKQPGSYIARWLYNLNDSVDMTKLQDAWSHVLQRTPILRSRTVIMSDGLPWQVVLSWKSAGIYLSESAKNTGAASSEGNVVAEYGRPLLQIYMGTHDNVLKVSAHHCLYDRWSMQSIFQDVRDAYLGKTVRSRPSYLPLLKPLGTDEVDKLRAGWKDLISSSDTARTSTASGYSGVPLASKTLQSSVKFCCPAKFTTAVLVTAAWALVCSRHRDPVDSVFGLTLWGRDILKPAALEMAFPAFSTLPFPTAVKEEETVEQLLKDINQRLSRIRQLQRLGVDQIAALGQVARNICKFSSVLVVQPELKKSDQTGPLQAKELQSYEMQPGDALLLECTTSDDSLSFRMYYDPNILSNEAAGPLLSQLCKATQLLSSEPETLVKDLNLLGEADMKQIRQWIRPSDRLVEDTLHDLVVSQALKTPQSTAVWQTGTKLSYEDLVTQARKVASLIHQRTSRNSNTKTLGNIGVFFPKTYVAIVAMIGILMSGCAYIPMDPSNPDARLDKIIEDAEVSLVLCSPELAKRREQSGCEVLPIDPQILATTEVEDDTCSKALTSDDNAYIMYTSGSTGVAKGVVISHGAICTSVQALARGFEIDSSTRAFQFSSFVWDASCHDIWITLSKGGVVCLPSDDERMEPTDFLRESEANYGMLTTTVASAMSADAIKYFKKVVFTGEPVTSSVLHRWVSPERVAMGAYGPTETTIVVLLTTFSSPDANHKNLGYCYGSTTWVVDQEDSNKLAPIGCVGELVTSGPTLAKHYWHDEAKTNKAFLENLEWFSQFPEQAVERVYLSGDLVCYNADGSLTYVGRKGGYTKIAGNRVDMGEIEHALYSEGEVFQDISLQVCKMSLDSQDRDILICFAKPQNVRKGDSCQFLDWDNEAREDMTRVVESLRHQLPPYMIPSLFVAVNYIPTMSSGKVDARMLNEMVQSAGHAALQERYGLKIAETPQNTAIKQYTSEEETLSKVWAQCLGLPQAMVKPSSHFFRMGGDSVVAMRVSARLRENNASLRVQDIFRCPVLSEMAAKIQRTNSTDQVDSPPEPFSLLDFEGTLSLEKAIETAAREINVKEIEIEDIFPCSPLQVQMLAATGQDSASYHHRDIFTISKDVEDEDVYKACQALMKDNAILRSRAFILADTGNFLQVILRAPDIAMLNMEQISTDSQDDEEAENMGLNGALCRFSLIRTGETRKLIWDMHHAIYDGNSHNNLLKQFVGLVAGTASQPAEPTPSANPPYQSFIRHLKSINKEESNGFWTEYLKGADYSVPRVFKQQSQRTTNKAVKVEAQVDWKPSEHTAATYLRAAYALTFATFAGSDDVVFAETLHGRDAAVPGIENIVGPTFSTIPCRVKINKGDSVESLLENVQNDATSRTQFSDLSVADIRSLGPEYAKAARLDTHFLVQTASPDSSYTELQKAGYEKANEGLKMGLAIPLSLAVTMIGKDKVRIEAIFNDSFVAYSQVELLLDHYKSTLVDLLACKSDSLVGDLSRLGSSNAKKILSLQPKATYSGRTDTIPNLVFADLSARARSKALYSSGESYTYSQMQNMAIALANKIGKQVQASKQLIATCLEKSPLAIIAQLAIMLSGHAYVPLDPSHPLSRHQHTLEQIGCSLSLVSSRYEKTFENSPQNKIVIDTAKDFGEAQTLDSGIKQPTPESIAYVMYTSGSTGEPKGVVIEHKSICTTVQRYNNRLGFTQDTRAMLFAAFTFDASVMETWSVLASGGCLCIPSEEERIQSLDEFVLSSKIDIACLTPTSGMLLDPSHHKDLKTLLLCGEKCTESDIERWAGNKTTLVNAYGPTEASVCAIMNTELASSASSDDIGTSIGGAVWIIDPDKPERHLPVGAVGEIYLSGEVLAREYLKAPEKTADKFISPDWPEWTDIGGDRVYKTGDLAWMDTQGRFHYVGRKDDQLKVNGIRIEAGEIETAVAEIVRKTVALTYHPSDSTNSGLALFFVPPRLTSTSSENKHFNATSILAMTEEDHSIMERMKHTLETTVPSAAVPDIYIPVDHLPTNASGKLDRKLLISLAEDLHPSQAAIFQLKPYEASSSSTTSTSSPGPDTPRTTLSLTTPTQKLLASIWATTLQKPADTLAADSHFIRTGGDSISAIRLSALARSKGLSLSVSTIYAKPVLSDMADACDVEAAERYLDNAVKTPEPFELLEDLGLSSPEETFSPRAERRGKKDYFTSF